jgi:predicted outer membrane protein
MVPGFRVPLPLAAIALISTVVWSTGGRANDAKDTDFLNDTEQSIEQEIHISHFAEQHAQTAAARELATHVAADDQKMIVDMQSVPAADTSPPSDPPDTKSPAGHDDDAYARLVQLSQTNGKAFDDEFQRELLKRDYALVAAFTDEAQRGDTNPAAKLARDWLPVVQQHVEMEKTLAKPPQSVPQAPTGNRAEGAPEGTTETQQELKEKGEQKSPCTTAAQSALLGNASVPPGTGCAH